MSAELTAVAPERRGRGGFWAGELAALRNKPGEWVEYEGLQRTTAWKIRKGLMAGISEGEFDVVCIHGHASDGPLRTFRIRFVEKAS